jgi:hypothetical protein
MRNELADSNPIASLPSGASRLAVYDGQVRIGSLVVIGRTVAAWSADDRYLGMFATRREAMAALRTGNNTP